MTVIATVIANKMTACASDSLIGMPNPDGSYSYLEYKQTKIISVPDFKGALSYWGLAKYGQTWTTYTFLTSLLGKTKDFQKPEDFANFIADSLNTEINRMRISKPRDKGLGIHFTAYEYIKDYWIPELFLITNWTDTGYTNVNPNGFYVSRETYSTSHKVATDKSHRDIEYRLKVKDYLDSALLIYNNGDPVSFNPTANAILGMINTASDKEILSPLNRKNMAALVRRPIEVVAEFQKEYFNKGFQRVGGKLHDLVIDYKGTYSSTTKDV